MKRITSRDGAVYELLSCIGRGGYARAYRARRVCRGSTRLVCLKVPIVAGPTRGVWEEARLLSAIDDESVVRLVEALELRDGRVALALELVDGICLAGLGPSPTLGTPLSAAAVAYVGLRVCRALAAASSAVEGGLVHRDVSPHNILISSHGDVKLTDFGIARAWDRDSWTDARCIKAKLSYASPEQLLGGSLDARSDLFALGVVLFQLAAGNHPFGGRSPRERARSILEAPAPATPPLDPSVAELLLALLQRCPQDRPASPAVAAESFLAATNPQEARRELRRRVAMLRPGLAGRMKAATPRVRLGSRLVLPRDGSEKTSR